MKYHRHKQHISHKKSSAHEKKETEPSLLKDKACVFTLSTDAKGVAKLEDGSIVFVENLLPGENASIKIHTKKASYKRATVINRENDSEERASPPCLYYMKCGGCQLQHIKQEKQADYKIQWFFETLKRIGKWDTKFIQLAQKKISIIYLQTNYYRRRIRLHFDGKYLGFMEHESRRVIEINACYIARPQLNKKITWLQQKLPAFSLELQKSLGLSHLEFDLELTESQDEKVLLNFIHINAESSTQKAQTQKIKQELYRLFEIQEDQLIHFKHPQLGKFRLKKESFIQPHFNSLESYYNHITQCVEFFLKSFTKKMTYQKNNLVIQAWDLYAGSGIFSCIPYFLAQKFHLQSKCLAVEGVKEAIESLKLNYKDIPVEGLVQDVHEFIEKQFFMLAHTPELFNKAHIIILDPPRTGVGIPNMQKIVELCAAESCVLYLACDPASFARDTQILLEGGFQNKQIFLFDSFGQTSFYEVLGFFVKGL